MADPRDPDEIEDPDDVAQGEDAGQLDDAGGDEAQAGQEPEGTEAEEGEVDPKPAARARERQEDFRRIAREEAAHRQRVEKELNELRAQQAQQRAPQEEPEDAFEARMQLLDVNQQMRERFQRSERRHQRELLMTRMQSADMADKAAYQSRAAANPRFKKYADEVEQVLTNERRNGRDFPRETILAFIVGRKVMENQGKVADARKTGKERIERQQARPGDNRSDRPAARSRSGGGDSVADLERRLEGVFI